MESATINNNINVIKEVRKLFNVRSNLSNEETKRIRKKLHRKETVYSVLKEKEQKASLTSRQKNMLRNDERYLKNISIHLKNLKKHFKKYQYGLDYLFNEPATLNNNINVKMLESFLMNVEVIFYVKKQTKLETHFTEKKQSLIF